MEIHAVFGTARNHTRHGYPAIQKCPSPQYVYAQFTRQLHHRLHYRIILKPKIVIIGSGDLKRLTIDSERPIGARNEL